MSKLASYKSTRQLKIAVVYLLPPQIKNQSPQLPSDISQGGAEIGTYSLVEGLSKRGNNVTFFTGKYAGIHVSQLKINRNLLIKYVDIKFKNNISSSFSFQLFRNLISGNFDVIHVCQVPMLFSLTACIAAKLRRKKTIITYRGMMPSNSFEYLTSKVVCFLADKITVQNTYGTDVVRRFSNISKVTTIPHGVDTKIFRKRELDKKFVRKYKRNNEKIILYVGRLIPAKGIDVTINALRKINDEINVKFLIIGKGPFEQNLRKLVHKLDLDNNVLFLGFVRQSKLPSFYSLADVFVLSSTYYDQNNNYIPFISENFGLVLIEAMACETLVIASRMGAIPNLVKHKINGLLYKERDVRELSRLLIDTFKNEKLRNKIINNAFNDIKRKYSLDCMIDKYLKLYKIK